MTPQAWLAWSPASVQPIDSRTLLRAPSAPTTYLARTTRSWPASSPAVRTRVTVTGYSPESATWRLLNS
jgi:hypothetical protein